MEPHTDLNGKQVLILSPARSLVKLDYMDVETCAKEYIDQCESLLIANRSQGVKRVALCLHGEEDVFPRCLYKHRPFVNRLLCKDFPKQLQHETKMAIAANLDTLGMVYKALQRIDDWTAEEINNFRALMAGGSFLRRGKSPLGMERRVATSLLFEYLHVPYSDEIFESAMACGERTGLFKKDTNLQNYRTVKASRSRDFTRVERLYRKSEWYRKQYPCNVFSTYPVIE